MSADASARAGTRIASVQHGNYGDVRRRLAAGLEETYGSQRYSIEALECLVGNVPHLIVSLEAPAVLERHGLAEYIGAPLRGKGWLPRPWQGRLRAWEILNTLERFDPTHLLLRANDIVGCRILEWANHRRIPTAVIVASRFEPAHPPSVEFCRLAKDDNVLFVGNHNRVATASLEQCGLPREKAVAWDYPPRATPNEFPVKSLPNSDCTLTVMYAGSVVADKGVPEAIEAVGRCRRASLSIRLLICGGGELKAGLQAHPGVREGWLEVVGNLPNDQILECMKASWVVVVPTRHSYPEALPLVITEALTTRTPVVLSDHPIFQEYFVDGKGVRLFPAGNADALASTLLALAADPADYRSLSEQTAGVWESLQIETRFHHLLERFAHEIERGSWEIGQGDK